MPSFESRAVTTWTVTMVCSVLIHKDCNVP
jgi:hypothetical protein